MTIAGAIDREHAQIEALRPWRENPSLTVRSGKAMEENQGLTCRPAVLFDVGNKIWRRSWASHELALFVQVLHSFELVDAIVGVPAVGREFGVGGFEVRLGFFFGI